MFFSAQKGSIERQLSYSQVVDCYRLEVMLKNQKLHLLPALIVAAELDGSPVTYIVLSLRLAGIGGDRACRSLLDELRDHEYVRIAKEKDSRDQREKVVRMTIAGWTALESYVEIVMQTSQLRPTLGPGGEGSRGILTVSEPSSDHLGMG